MGLKIHNAQLLPKDKYSVLRTYSVTRNILNVNKIPFSSVLCTAVTTWLYINYEVFKFLFVILSSKYESMGVKEWLL